ncbi:hypothetical protein T439DRAFT_315468 [Meredithblackwellia eburnea MCA 4105]
MEAELPPTKRPALSCGNCRRRKIKCDQKYPCGPCVIRKDEDTCKPVSQATSVPPGIYTPISDHLALAKDVANLQAQINDLQLALSRLSSDKSTPRDSSISPGESTTSAGTIHDGHPEEEAAYVLEGFAMGSRVARDRITQNISSPHKNGNQNSSIGFQHKQGKSISDILGPQLGFDAPAFRFLFPQGFSYVQKAISALPCAWQSQALVQTFFTEVHWQHRTIRKSAYMQEARLLLELGPMTPPSLVSPSLLCVHLMILCMGYYCLPPHMVAGFSLTPTEKLQKMQEMFGAAQAVLWLSDYLNNQSLESLQAIVLMGLYQYSVDEQSDAHWSLLGSAIKIAQNLGLSNLVDESLRSPSQWSPQWASLERREMGRRVWWNLVSLDWTHASAHGGHFAITPRKNFCAVPMNVDDEDLQVAHCVPKPMEQYTVMSLQILKIEFLKLEGEHLEDGLQPEPTAFHNVLSMDLKILAIKDNFPAYFQCPESQPATVPAHIFREAAIINIVAEHRLVRLHRPYLIRGYREERYAASKDRCVQSALQILRLLKLCGERSPGVLKFWVVMFFGFSAAVVSFIQLTREPDNSLRDLLHNVLGLFRSSQEISTVARKASDLLQSLLNSETELRPSKKRLRDGEDSTLEDQAFAAAVRRLVVSTSTNGSAQPGSEVEDKPLTSSPPLPGSTASHELYSPTASALFSDVVPSSFQGGGDTLHPWLPFMMDTFPADGFQNEASGPVVDDLLIQFGFGG